MVGEIEAAAKRLLQLRDLGPHAAAGKLGQLRGLCHSGQERLQDRPRRDRVGLRSDAGQLDAGVLQHLLQALDRPCALLDLRLAQTGQVAQPPDLQGRHEARAHQPVLDQLTDPGRVDHVRLAAGDVAQVAGVQEPALEVRLERVEDRAPVDACRLHADQRDAEALEPVGKRLQPAERGREAARLLLALPAALGRQAYGCHHAVAVSIETGTAFDENVHSLLLPGGDK